MSKNTVHKRFLSLCLVLAMLTSFPGVAWAELSETDETKGDLYVVSSDYVYWRFDIDEGQSGRWSVLLNGNASTAHATRFPLVVHPVRNPGRVDSGRNDTGRQAMADQFRYQGTYWQTTPDGVLDVENGSEDPNSDYNLYLDTKSATLYLRDAYLKGQSCLLLTNNVSTIMPGTDNTLTIDLEGENTIVAYHSLSYSPTRGISFDASNSSWNITSDLILTGDGSLEMECGSVGNSAQADSYAIYLQDGDLTIDGVTVDVDVQTAGGDFKTRTAIKANDVTVKSGSSLSITLEEGSEGVAFDAQSVVVEEGASLSVTLTRNSSLFSSGTSTQSVFALSDSAEKLQLKDGGELTIIVESGITDLSDVFTAETDLSKVNFQVDGMLILPESSKPESLNGNITGGGVVLIPSSDESGGSSESDGTVYSIEDGKLQESAEGAIYGNIEVSTGGDEDQVTEEDGLGYTWTKEAWYINDDGILTGPVEDTEGGEDETGGSETGDTTGGTTGDDTTGGTTGDDTTGGTTGGDTTTDGGTTDNSKQGALVTAYNDDGNIGADDNPSAGDAGNEDDVNPSDDDNVDPNPGEDPDPDNDTIDVWTLEILRPNVVGDIVITQVLPETMGDVFDPEAWDAWVAEYLAGHDNEVKMRVIAEGRCNVFGDVKIQYDYYYVMDGDTCYVPDPEELVTLLEYLKVLGSLTFDTDEMYVDNVTYKCGKVEIAGTLDGISIAAWKAALLPEANLTLTKGVLLTENNTGKLSEYDELIEGTSVILADVRDETWDKTKLDKYTAQLKEEFFGACEDSFIMDKDAVYNVAASEVSPVQVTVNVKRYIRLDDVSESLYPQVIITLEGNDVTDEDEDLSEDEGEGEDTGETGDANEGEGEAPLVIGLTLTQENCKQFIVLPEGSSLLPEDASFALEKTEDGDMYTYTFSIQYPEQEDETGTDEDGTGTDEDGTGTDEDESGDSSSSSSSSSSGGGSSPLPTVDPAGGDGSEAGGNETGGSGSSGGYSQPSNCVSDTLGGVTVDDSYQFKITSTDGTVPVVTVDNENFRVEFVSQDGNDYYVKIYPVGEAGSTSDVYVNGVKVATATVGGSGSSGGYSQPSNCVCDTIGQLTVNGAYQFKITSTDGTVPTLTVNGSAFRAEIVSQEGNDYYVKIYAVGEAGSTGEVYVNGVRVATASIASTYGGVVSDTTAPFTVRQGDSYQFCFTSDTMPALAAGSSSFTVVYVGNDGKKWYYKIYATGKPGDGCGFYVNGAPFTTAIAHITA